MLINSVKWNVYQNILTTKILLKINISTSELTQKNISTIKYAGLF